MLFSEPKIPQSDYPPVTRCCCCEFQCSSASRKFLNAGSRYRRTGNLRRFSALQRAENSSMGCAANGAVCARKRFSALQRAENSSIASRHHAVGDVNAGFSALQRAENSSIALDPSDPEPYVASFSALQRAENSSI